MESLFSCWLCLVKTLFLLAVCNGAPVVVRGVLDRRFAWPVDLNHSFWDGRRLFGKSKTWRGVFSAVLFAMVSAPFLGWSIWFGAGFGALAMAGDLLSSFIKRRLGYAPSSRFRILDTVPESLFPVWLLRGRLGMTPAEACSVVICFVLLELALSPLLYRLHIRKRPY